MIKVKDGYAKLINTSYTGDISLVLLSNGGTIGYDVSTNTILATIGSNVASADKLKNKVNLWGLDFDGTTDVNGSIVMTNDSSIAIKTTAGTAISLLHFPASHNFHLGYGAASNGFNTYIDGKNIYLRYGTSHTTGLLLNNSGNITIGSSDLASTNYKLYVDGLTRITSSTNIGLQIDSSYKGAVTRGVQVLNQSVPTGDTNGVALLFGQSLSAYNCGNIAYRHIGENSTNNYVSLGLYGSDNILVCKANGNVGIGTTDPSTKLHVSGNFRVQRKNDTAAYLEIESQDITVKYLGYDSDGYINHIFYSNGTELMRLAGNTKVMTVQGNIVATGGFFKLGSSDDYVLLGGGGHKSIASFQTTYDGRYVTLETTLTITGLKTFSGTGASLLTIDRNSTNPAWIKFAKNGTLLGYIGIDNNKNPVVNLDEVLYQLLHSGNTHIKNGVITINGVTITPMTSASLSKYVLKTGDTMTGALRINTDSPNCLYLQNTQATSTSKYAAIRFVVGGTHIAGIGVSTSNGILQRINSDFSASYAIWDSGNDGSGSGLDADLLDGQHGSYYAAASSLGNYLPLTGGTMTGKINFSADPSDTIWIGATAESSGTKSFLDFYISDDATDAFRWKTTLYKEGGNVSFTMMQLSGSNSGVATLALTGNMTATGTVTANKFVSGNGVNDFSAGTVKLDVLNIPTSSGGTTFGPGSNGQVLKSNGTTVYWASDSNSNTWRPVSVNGTSVATSTTGTGTLNIVLGTGITVSGAVNSLTITNAGVRSVTIGTGDNANKVAVNTNGTTNYLTIPYATTASLLSNTFVSDPNKAASGLYLKWYSLVSQASGYAGTNYGFPVSNNANGILWLGTHSGPYGWQMGFSSNSRIYVRYISNNTFSTAANGGSWSKIAWTSDIPTKTSQLTNDSGFLTAHLSLANYVTLNGTLTISGTKTFTKDITLYASSGDSPKLIFLRSTLNASSLIDWCIYDISGDLSFRKAAGNGWEEVFRIDYDTNNSTVVGNSLAAGFVKSGSSDSYALLGGGGHKAIGNATGNIPLSNGTKCVDLHADLLDGYNASGIWEYGTSLSPYNASSTGWYLFLTLVGTNNDGQVDFVVSAAETGINLGVADYFHFATRPSSPSRVFTYTHLGANNNYLRDNIYVYTDDNKTYRFYMKYTSAGSWNWFCKIKHISSRGCTLTYSGTWQTAAPSGTAYQASFSGAVNYANSAGSVAWGNVTGKPTIPSVGNGTVTIKLAGSTKGSFTMNQSGNTTIELTDTTDWLNVNSTLTYGASGLNYFNINGTAGNTKANNTPTSAWYHILRMNHANAGGYLADIAVPLNDVNGIYWRQIRNGSFYGWYRVVDSNNYAGILDGRYRNAKISREGGSYSWYNIQQYNSSDTNPSYYTADCAIINITSYSGWLPWIRAVDSEKGSWTIGLYTTNFHIGYIPKSNTTNNLTRNWTFYKDGSLGCAGNVTATHFYESSDINLKTNIEIINTSDNIPLLKSFDWKEDGSHSYGLIAQELEEQGYSELVNVKDDGYKTVNYSAALSLIVGKLQVKIKELEKEIEELKNK